MPFNATGLFERLYRWIDDRDAGIKILASRMDTEMDGIVAGINDMVEGDVDWRGPMRGAFGTAAAPAWSFAEDSDSGLYRVAANELALAVGGAKVLDIGANGVGALDGTEGAPSFTFSDDVDSGLFRVGDDNLGISVGGSKAFEIGIGGVGTVDGTEAAPSYVFQDDPDTGVYRVADDTLGISVGGSKVIEVGGSNTAFLVPAITPNGTQALPGLAVGVPGTGLSRGSGPGNLYLSLDGTDHVFLSDVLFGPSTTNGLSLGSDGFRWKGVFCDNGSASQVALSAGVNNTGLYRDSISGNLKAVRGGIEVWSASGSSFASELARANTTAVGANARIDPSSGVFQRSTSARKYKQDIRPISDQEVLSFLALSGVSFRSRIETDDQTRRHFGVIADDAHALGLEALVSYGDSGEIEGFQYDRAVAILLETVKRLTVRVTALESA